MTIQARHAINLYTGLARKEVAMASRVQRKNYRIDMAKLHRAKRVLGTRTETETIHRALDFVADEAAFARALKALVVRGHGQIEALEPER